jgi:hypothetical protein
MWRATSSTHHGFLLVIVDKLDIDSFAVDPYQSRLGTDHSPERYTDRLDHLLDAQDEDREGKGPSAR